VRWNSGVVVVAAVAALLTAGLAFIGAPLLALLTLVVLGAVAGWVAMENAAAGYLTFFGPLLVLLAGTDASPALVTMFAMLMIAAGITARSPRTRKFGVAFALMSILAPILTAVSADWYVLQTVAVAGILLFVVVRTKTKFARASRDGLEEIDHADLDPPGKQVTSLVAAGFELIAVYRVVGSEVATLVSTDRTMWAETTWRDRAGVVQVVTEAAEGSLRTYTSTLTQPQPDTFVQRGATSADDAAAWHARLVELAIDRGWHPSMMTNDAIDVAVRADYADVDASWGATLALTGRALVRRWTGVRGPVDLLGPAAFDAWLATRADVLR